MENFVSEIFKRTITEKPDADEASQNEGCGKPKIR